MGSTISVPGTGNDIVGRVVAIIHEPLGHVLDLDAVFLPRSEFEDALVRDQPARALVQHREECLEPPGHIIGVEDRDLRGGA